MGKVFPEGKNSTPSKMCRTFVNIVRMSHSSKWTKYAEVYDPVKVASIDGEEGSPQGCLEMIKN